MEIIYLQKSTEKLNIQEGQLIHRDHETILNRYPICATEQIVVYGNGRRVQESVFECEIGESRYRELCARLRKIRRDEDKIFSYYLRSNSFFEEIK